MTAAAGVQRIGVVGAGTMGAGIAQVSACAGAETVLYDPITGAAGAAADRIRESLARGVARGRLSEETAGAALTRLRTTDRLADVFDRELIIEAAPEDLEIKLATFAELDAGCDAAALLATNTSSIPVTQIASATRLPHRVIGMHFFNPVPAMRLAEVVPAAQTSTATVAAAIAAATQLGKHPIVATDGPGFLVNRCGRPFYTEALRIVDERVATPAQVDRICRIGGGFPMGPFELMDLVGIDVGLAVMNSFAERIVRRAALASEPAAGASRRGWAARSQERSRLARLRGPEPPRRRPGVSAPDRRSARATLSRATGLEAARVRELAAEPASA